MRCPRCQAENSPGEKFCGECGTPLKSPSAGGPPEASYADLRQEVEHLTRGLSEALEQQTATSEILWAISEAQTDAQPVFDAIARSTVRLCEAARSTLWRPEGDLFRCVARYEMTPEGHVVSAPRGETLDADSLPGRAIRERQILRVNDVPSNPTVPPKYRERARIRGYRSLMAVPMVREGLTVGVITVVRPASAEFSDQQVGLVKTFADQAVIAIENVRLFNETKEALEQQTATADILRAISSSPADIQPVLDTLVKSAVRFVGAHDATIHRLEGQRLPVAAHYGPIPYPVGQVISLGRGTVSGRSILDRRPIHVIDLQAETEEFPEGSSRAREAGTRTALSVPLLREGVALGSINLRRAEAVPFTDKQIALLQTFADQAVIAIENVRLFNETKEALEQQTATSEILKVISGSPTDIQPVFDAIARNAANVCGAFDAIVGLAEGDAGVVRGHHGPIPPPVGKISLRGTVTGQAIREGRPVHVEDLFATEDFPIGRGLARESDYRTVLVVPLLRDGTAIGAIGIRRTEVRPFTDKQIALLQTFADQAVIAIENVRLFTELQARNRELTAALDTQTATSDILRVISQSQTDVQPVFDTIVQSAARLCHAANAGVFLTDGRTLDLPANYGSSSPEALAAARAQYPRPLDLETTAGVAILTRSVIHVPDIEETSAAEVYTRRVGRLLGVRSMVAVPMLRKGEVVGAINLSRQEPARFSDAEVELLKTFADQAVIAIENVRLFKELEARNRDLTATAEILQVISHSPTDVQPVFETIGERAGRLCEAEVSVVSIFDGELLHLAASHGVAEAGVQLVRDAFPMRPDADTITSRAFRTRAVVHVPDVLAEQHLETTASHRASGFRSCLGVPMLREGKVIGVIFLARTKAEPYADSQIELVKTFADQAVIAIENVRLFKELEARTQDLTRSVGELRALGEVGQAISSTLDLQTVLSTIVARATQLSGTDAGVIYEYDEVREVFMPRATARLEAEIVQTMLAAPVRKGEGATGRLAEIQEPVQLPDILEAPAESRVRAVLERAGYRALLAVPLVREGRLLGGLTVIRRTTGEFASPVIDLLRTFATQSALAIQNARLFLEIEDKSHQLEVASQHKSEFLANMSHELRTPLNAIIGFSEVLTERMFGELNEKQAEYLKDIYASGTHLLSLINDILDLSKIEAGRMELELTDFDLPTALDNALTLVRERAGRRGVALHMNVDERLGQIQADERKIRQVVLNLLSNAIKFTPEGGRIEVGAVPKDGFVEVSVSDTGVGIAPEDQEAVFEEFRQVGTAEKKAEGTGLGLTLCRKFIELHGGRIWVTSQVGVGSTFTFTIPERRGE